MNIILILIISSLGIALFFLASFIWATRSGQFDDTCTPSMRLLTDDEPGAKSISNPTNTRKAS